MNYADLLSDNSFCYQIKGRKAVLTFDSRITKIPFKNFFNVKFTEEEDGSLNVEYFSNDEDSVDILCFALVGLVASISKLGLYETACNGGSIDCGFDYLDEYMVNKFPLVPDFETYKLCDIASDKYFIFNNDLEKIKEFIQSCRFPSLFMTKCYSSTNFRVNTQHIKLTLSYLFSLAMREDAEAILTEIFCHFLPMIYIGCVVSFPELVISDNGVKSCMTRGIINKNLNKFEYRTYQLKDNLVVSDIEGFSILLVHGMITNLWNEAYEFNNIRKKLYKNVIGNDYLLNYIRTGSPIKLVKAIQNEKSYTYSCGDYTFGVTVNNLWGISEFYKDLDVLGIDHSTFYLSSACCDHMFDLSSIKSINATYLSRAEKTYLHRLAEQLRCIEADYDKNLQSLERKNEDLVKENKHLKREVETLNTQLRGYSHSLSVDESTSLKSNYKIMCDKVAQLTDKLTETESKLELSETSMQELLASLSVNTSDSTVDVSREEIIKYLNKFNIIILGGRNDLTDKLLGVGLKNFTQVLNHNDMPRINNFDFMVSMTSFMSHKLFYGGLSKLDGDRNKNIYFNGTNLDALINSVYNHITHYYETI